MEIRYVDRKTNTVEVEKIYGHKALSLFYGDSWTSKIFSFLFTPILSKIPLFSRIYGFFQKRPASAKKIDPFISTYGVDRSEFASDNFHSFNDFFIRKLKKEVRPIDLDPKRAVFPADGRYLVFPSLKQEDLFYVKGRPFDLATFLQNGAYARRYHEGSMVIARLCPTDYHRFHFVADGIPSKAKRIDGDYHSVSPVALKKNVSILWENKRSVTDIDTETFGKILYVEVGAICVGTIHQTYTPEKKVFKGEEKGFFSFGGSCIVLLFEKGSITFDKDLVLNTQKGFETKANFGESLGLTT